VKKSSKLKTALVAVSGGLAAVPAGALELGDVKVHSTIGQPLRASIAYALGPNEALADTCVSLQSSGPASGLPSISDASMIVTNGVIAITGSSVVREPIVTMRLNVRCPYTAQLTREYMMFIDPPGAAREAVATPTTAPAPVAAQPQRTATVAAQPRSVARQRPIDSRPITNAARYQVQPGDSLSEIVQRIENRPVGLWNAVNAIFAANPDAFIDNDPNKLKAGSWLNIPSFGSGEPVSVADVTGPVAAPTEPAARSTAYTPADAESSWAVEDTGVPAEQSKAESSAGRAALADLQPGDVIADTSDVAIDAMASSASAVIIPDTALEGPESTSNSPNTPIAQIQPVSAPEATKTNWLLWLGGGGLAIILIMLLFGRKFRDQLGSAPIAPAVPQRRKTDTQTVEIIADEEMHIADDSPTEENLALDADLIVGTGLQEGTEVDVAQDFGFAATTDLDLELPEEMSSGGDLPETDIIAPIKIEESSILESEVLPEDDDYDMSVIVDATKMPLPDEVTAKDLAAIQLESGDETLITDDYTVSQEVDYKIIEQDYEDEMTATQRLNSEIAKAAEELATRMDDDLDGGDTEEMPLATVHELDVTAQLPSGDDAEIGDLDDTGVNPTVNQDAADKTVEMEAGDNDKTAEMEVEGGKVDTKAG
jgi:hypothetical protein